ncbi:FbpB family small basic protein [Bacillus sp. 1NLA3E]|jgi:hypothetical protein|nr:FbpB family small basic protein [Bacillus sp. 1NLA3E]
MKRRNRKNFQQLVNQNRLEIETNPFEMERIEKKIEEKHLKSINTSGSH